MSNDDDINALRKANESLRGQIRGLTAKVDRLEAERDKLNAEVGATLNRLQAAHGKLDRLSAALKSVADEITDDAHEDSEDPDEMIDSLMKIHVLAKEALASP